MRKIQQEEARALREQAEETNMKLQMDKIAEIEKKAEKDEIKM
jgi:hypothetical protein